MPTTSNRSETIPALTGLRFVAALMVFFSHYPIQGLGELPTRLMLSGYVGVTFFFVLSGFIITHNYLDKFESEPLQNTPSYLWARFSRVYPLYILTMLFVWLQNDAHGPFAIYLFAVQAWHSDIYVIQGLNSPAWSISVEFFLYLFFPIIILIFIKSGILRSGAKMLVVALLAVAIQLSLAAYFTIPPRNDLALTHPDSAHQWLYNFPLPRALDFTLGVLAAAYYRKSKQAQNSHFIWHYSLYASLIAIALLISSKTHFLSAFSWSASYSGLFALLILSMAKTQTSKLSRFLSSKPAILLGEASFAFYLIHIIAFPMFQIGLPRTLFSGLAFELLFLGLIITMSIGLHISVEKPLRKLLIGSFKKPEEKSIIQASKISK